MKTIIERFNAPTPNFFKKVYRIGFLCGGIAGVLLAPGVAVPIVIKVFAGHLLTASTIAVGISKLTVDDTKK